MEDNGPQCTLGISVSFKNTAQYTSILLHIMQAALYITFSKVIINLKMKNLYLKLSGNFHAKYQRYIFFNLEMTTTQHQLDDTVRAFGLP